MSRSPFESDHGPLVERSEPLIGFRKWRVSEGPAGQPLLTSLFYPTSWSPRAPVRAGCLRPQIDLWRRRERPHAAPEPGCVCGVYAYRLPHFDHYTPEGPTVLGVIEGWGRYILGTTGWRSEYARPVALLRTPNFEDVIEAAADLYELDVIESWPQAS